LEKDKEGGEERVPTSPWSGQNVYNTTNRVRIAIIEEALVKLMTSNLMKTNVQIIKVIRASSRSTPTMAAHVQTGQGLLPPH